jgi:glycosyltransferase involved in cell wall biosynthesis
VISVIVPAFNEQEAIAEAIRDIRAVLDGAGYDGSEIIVVDDGSVDETATFAEAEGARVLVNLQNMGYGFSLKHGITEAKHETIVIVDADGTYPVEDIPKLVERHRQGYHMVVGARSGKNYWGSSVKAPLRILLKWLVEFTTGRRIPDVNSGLRVFSRKEVIPYFEHLSNTFSFTTTVTMAYMLNYKFVEYVEIDYRERIGITKVRMFRDSLRVLQQIVATALYFNPLKIFLAVAIMMIIAAGGSIIAGLATGIISAVWLGLGFITVSIIVFAMGLFAQAMQNVSIGSDRE